MWRITDIQLAKWNDKLLDRNNIASVGKKTIPATVNHKEGGFLTSLSKKTDM